MLLLWKIRCAEWDTSSMRCGIYHCALIMPLSHGPTSHIKSPAAQGLVLPSPFPSHHAILDYCSIFSPPTVTAPASAWHRMSCIHTPWTCRRYGDRRYLRVEQLAIRRSKHLGIRCIIPGGQSPSSTMDRGLLRTGKQTVGLLGQYSARPLQAASGGEVTARLSGGSDRIPGLAFCHRFLPPTTGGKPLLDCKHSRCATN